MLNAVSTVVSMCGVIVSIAAGVFVFWKFHIFSERAAKLVFTVDLIIRLEHQNQYICELIAEIENVGNVGVEIPKIKFTLYGLEEDDPIDETNKNLKFAVRFPHVIKRGEWLQNSYVEPKSPQRFSHVCAVPTQFKAVLAFGRLGYSDSDSDSDQTAQKVISLMSPTGPGASAAPVNSPSRDKISCTLRSTKQAEGVPLYVNPCTNWPVPSAKTSRMRSETTMAASDAFPLPIALPSVMISGLTFHTDKVDRSESDPLKRQEAAIARRLKVVLDYLSFRLL